MSNLTETSAWDAGVYQFATTDPIQGGPGGIDNQPHQSLADRTLWLRNRMAAAITQAGLTEGISDNTQLAEAVVLHCANITALRACPIPVVPNSQTVFMHTRGQVTEGDGRAAAYKWIYNSSTADDGVSVIQPASLPALGRWFVCQVNAGTLGGQGAAFFAGAAATAAAISLRAPLLSPNFTGNPTAPSGAIGDRTQSLATDQFVNDNFLSKTGITLTWNGNPNTYFKIATLPPSTNSTADSINIRATLNVGYVAAADTIFDGILGNRGGTSYVYNLYGPNNTQVAIQAFQEADGSVSVYAVCGTTFGYAYISISNTGTQGITGPSATLYPVPTATTVVTGTLIFASNNTAAYPPFLWVSAPGAYLTAAIAAATYLPLFGGTIGAGGLTLNGSDLKVFRAGGTTGVVFLNSAGNAYVYWDGSNYNMPTGELIVNGFQMARLNSPTFIGTPSAPTPPTADADTSIATTAFVKNQGYDTVADVNAKLTAYDTIVSVNAKVAPGTSFNQNGYRKNPDGTITQWGVNAGTPGSPGATVPFPIPFPNFCLNVVANAFQQNATVTILSYTKNNFQLINGVSGNCNWHAEGY